MVTNALAPVEYLGDGPKPTAESGAQKSRPKVRLGDTVEYQKKHGQVIGIYSSSDRARWVTVKILGPVTRHFPEHTWEGWPLLECRAISLMEKEAT